MTRQYFVSPQDVQPYSPAGHSGTVNRRLIGPETVGAKHVEVVLGEIAPQQGAHPHAHPGMEQVCYLLQGQAQVDMDGQSRTLSPGECCFFPAGMPHTFTAIGDVPVKLLVIYSPPYGEDPSKTVKG
jgi:quercetin dioxygenase-like cupin family protein